MAENVCKNCGAEIPKGGKFCPNCRVRVTPKVGAGIFCLLLFIGMGVLMVQDKRNPDDSWLRGHLRKTRQKKRAAKLARSRPEASQPKASHRKPKPPMMAEPFVRNKRTPSAVKSPPKAPSPTEKKSKYYAMFKPPMLGSEITVRLKSRKDVKGILLDLTDNSVEVEQGKAKFTVNKKQIMARSRIRLFADDFVNFREWLDKNKTIKAQPRDPGSRSESPVKLVAPAPLSEDPSPTSTMSPTPAQPRQKSAADIFFDAFED